MTLDNYSIDHASLKEKLTEIKHKKSLFKIQPKKIKKTNLEEMFEFDTVH